MPGDGVCPDVCYQIIKLNLLMKLMQYDGKSSSISCRLVFRRQIGEIIRRGIKGMAVKLDVIVRKCVIKKKKYKETRLLPRLRSLSLNVNI